MWTSYEALCELGATDIDPTSVFGVRPSEIDQVQARMHQQTVAAQEAIPLQEKSVLTPHHFSPPEAGAAAGMGGMPMDFGTPGGASSIGPKATLFQTAQKSNFKGEPGSAAIIPNHLQFNTPGLTPIPMQHDASFLQHTHNRDQHHAPSAAGGTFQQSSMMSAAQPSFHGFGDSFNPHTVRRAKHVAARLYYQPSPETPSYNAGHSSRAPPSFRAVQFSSLAEIGEASARRYLRGRSALQSANSPGVSDGTSVSETPLVGRGGRLSDVSTVRRPRTLFLSENKAMRENTNDLNQSSSTALEHDDEENTYRPLRSRSQQDGEAGGQPMDDENENHPDDERSNMMMAEENGTTPNTQVNGGGQTSLFLAEDEKPVSTIEHQSDVVVDEDEDALMERQAAVQQILELFCLMGAGYWRLCQVRPDRGPLRQPVSVSEASLTLCVFSRFLVSLS